MNKKDKNSIKDTGFKTPETYFETFEDKLMDKLKRHSPLNEVSKTGFEMPKGYLSGLEDKVMKELRKEDSKVISLFNRKNLMYFSGIAAAVLIMLSIFIKNDDNIEFDYETVESYLAEQDLSSYELAALLDEEALLEDEFTIIEEQLDESSLEDYLLENSHIEDILEQ